MTRNTMLFFAAFLAATTNLPLSHMQAVADGIRLAQNEPQQQPPQQGQRPNQRPPQGTPPGTPGQRPANNNARPGTPPATAQTPPGQQQHSPPPPATAQTPPGQQHTPATAQTPPAQPQLRPGTPPPPATAQTPPTQPQLRPGTPPPPATAQTPPAQPQLRPGTPPPATAQTPPAQPQLRPGTPPPATAQTPPAQPQLRPGTPPPPATAQTPAGGPPRPGFAPVVANVPVDPKTQPQHLDQLRNERHEVQEGGRTIIQEADRTIIREGGRDIIRHDEAARFRFNAREVNVEHRGNTTVVVALRPDGSRVITETDETGRLIRRVRRDPQGREIILIDNAFEPRGPGFAGYFVNLPPPVIRVPRELYVRDLARASAEDVYLTLMAPPIERIDRRYALDEIRYSEPLRVRMPRVDVDTVNFATGSWEIAPDQMSRLAFVAQGVTRALQRNPSEVFLIEGYTDAVGNDVDNLSLSDRRAESVAVALTNQFGIPAENLTTQGYGKQFLKIPTDGPEPANRRVAVQRITPLLMGQN